MELIAYELHGNQRSMSSNSYRPDIDGLRAVAVTLVVGFHAFPGTVRGGFIGVDVFFVISGYLISSIIFASVDQGQFSFLDFYARRARRIFPALAVVLGTALVIGWFVLLPDQYEQLGWHALGGATFVSNFLLWGESGYFDSAAETKPLLHLWSLAIEEQFYLFFPLLIVAAGKIRLHRIGLLVAVGLASFAINIATYQTDPTGNFYSPQSRFWELMVGAVLAAVAARSPFKMPATAATLCSFLGLALLGAAALLLTGESSFPGWWAVLPTVGAALLIFAGSSAPVNSVILSNRVVVWIGLISFPLYLWHWIFLTFALIYAAETPPVFVRAALVGLSVLLAWLTYRLIERPIRFGGQLRPMALGAFVGVLAAGIAGYFVFSSGGYPIRIADRQEFARYFENSLPDLQYSETSGVLQYYRNDCNFYDIAKYREGKSSNIPVAQISASCTQSMPEKKTVFLWGDSHVQQLYYGLTKTLPADWQVNIVASSGCLPRFEELDSEADFCVRSNWYATKSIRAARPAVVLIAQNSGHSAEGMRAMAEQLQAEGVKGVVFAGPVPHWAAPLSRIILTKFWNNTPERTFEGVTPEVLAADQNIEGSVSLPPGAYYLSLVDVLCNDEGCLTRVGPDRMHDISTWDYAHLTLASSEFVAKTVLTEAIKSAAEWR